MFTAHVCVLVLKHIISPLIILYVLKDTDGIDPMTPEPQVPYVLMVFGANCDILKNSKAGCWH